MRTASFFGILCFSFTIAACHGTIDTSGEAGGGGAPTSDAGTGGTGGRTSGGGSSGATSSATTGGAGGATTTETDSCSDVPSLSDVSCWDPSASCCNLEGEDLAAYCAQATGGEQGDPFLCGEPADHNHDGRTCIKSASIFSCTWHGGDLILWCCGPASLPTP